MNTPQIRVHAHRLHGDSTRYMPIGRRPVQPDTCPLALTGSTRYMPIGRRPVQPDTCPSAVDRFNQIRAHRQSVQIHKNRPRGALIQPQPKHHDTCPPDRIHAHQPQTYIPHWLQAVSAAYNSRRFNGARSACIPARIAHCPPATDRFNPPPYPPTPFPLSADV